MASVPEAQAGNAGRDVDAFDIEVVEAAVDLEAIDHRADRGAAAKEGRSANVAKIDRRGDDERLHREPVAAVREVEPGVDVSIVCEPVEADARVELSRFTLGESEHHIRVAQEHVVATAGNLLVQIGPGSIKAP